MMKVSPQGGIRLSRSSIFHPTGHITVCAAPHDPKKSRIYLDHFDSEGIFHYTGEGQEGPQKMTRGNLAISQSNDIGKPLFLYKKHNEGGKWEFMGRVEFIDYYESQQPDSKGENRQIYVFRLELIEYPMEKLQIPEIHREIEELLSIDYGNGLDRIIKEESERIKKSKPRKREVLSRKKTEYQRAVKIISLLKQKHAKCQVCEKKHFLKENRTFYSEAHHLIPWKVSYNDSIENVIILCPRCHRKFHFATVAEKRRLFNLLKTNFTMIDYLNPEWSH